LGSCVIDVWALNLMRLLRRGNYNNTSRILSVLWMRNGFNPDPDPAFYLNADPDPVGPNQYESVSCSFFGNQVY
jgi:hypothetical protein